ncbi:MAG: fructose-bisphosphatase class II, partial [Methyloceanibacter sp.]
MSEAVEGTELDRALALDIVRVTEATAVAAAQWLGRGDEASADAAAAAAMHREVARLPFEGVVVVGEGEEGDCPVFYLGEKIGAGSPSGAALDLAVDPIEGSTLCAKALPNAMSVLVVAERGSLLKVPPIYMEKVAVGPGYPEGIVRVAATPTENLNALAKAKGVRVQDLTVCVLDRPRHGYLIEEIRTAGAALRLIGDGDIAGVIHVTNPSQTGIDMYLGIGGAAEGVLAAAALACIGGQMEGRLVALNKEHRAWAKLAGITDLTKTYGLEDMVAGDLSFAATGITDGSM